MAAARLDRLLSAEETSNATQNRRVRCLVHAIEAFHVARRGDQADMAFSQRRAAVDRDKAISNELAQVPKRHILFTKFYFEIFRDASLLHENRPIFGSEIDLRIVRLGRGVGM